MRAGDAALRVAFGILVVIAALLVAGQLLGQPVVLSYVETGSMRPQLQPGDGFVAIPAAVAGPIETGDVVVFDAERLNGGDLVTHRVVGRTAEGLVTRGDANPVTDQDAGEPPVRDAQVVAEALQVGGRIVVVPKLGALALAADGVLDRLQRRLAAATGTRALLGPQGLSYLLFGVGALLYVGSAVFGSDSERDRSRRTRRSNERVNGTLVVVALTALLVVALTLSMVVPSGVHQFDLVSSETDAPGPGVIQRGTTEKVAYRVPSNGPIPVVAFLEPDGGGIEPAQREVYVPSNRVRTVPVALTAPDETGYYRRHLVERRYLAVLPGGTIRALYGIHPWLPVLAIDALLGLGFAGIGLALVGDRTMRIRGAASGGATALGRWFR